MKQNKHQLEHLPTLLVQQIRLQWYKDCRGGNAAAQRNQYPRAMRLPKDFFSYYPFGLPTHFASIVQRPDGFQIDRDCRRLMEWKPNGTMRLHPFELIQQEPGIHVRYADLLFDGIGAALVFNFKRLKREEFDGLKSKIDWSMVESFPFPASFEEQQYIGDEGKIHVYSWDGRQETNLVGPYSVRDLYLEHFGK